MIKTDPNDLIAQTACEIYAKSEKIEGRDLDNWLEAERVLRKKQKNASDERYFGAIISFTDEFLR